MKLSSGLISNSLASIGGGSGSVKGEAEMLISNKLWHSSSEIRLANI